MHLSALFNFGRLGDMNKTIGIAIAKARLFEMIDRVEAGETIVIVRNGAPVAQLRPLERESLEDAKRTIGQRVPTRNKVKQYWQLNGTSCPDISQRF
jgi:prevent-host-death family protein